MNTANYSNDIAGIKTLWIIRFDGQFPHLYGQEKEKPRFDLLFPSPINKDRWLVVNLEKNKNDLQTIERFQQLCEEAKQRCNLQSTKPHPDNPVETAGKEVDNLAQLLLYFNEIMRQIRKKTTDNPES